MGLAITNLLYGWAVVIQSGITGTPVWVETNRWQLQARDVIPIMLGVHERCVVAGLEPLEYVKSWVTNDGTDSYTNSFTNTISLHSDKAMLDAGDDKARAALPSFVLTPPGGSNDVAMMTVTGAWPGATGAWPWQVTAANLGARAAALCAMTNTVADCTGTQAARWHGVGTGLTVQAAEEYAWLRLEEDTSVTNTLGVWVLVDAYSNRTWTSDWNYVYEILPGQDYSSDQPLWNTYQTNLEASGGTPDASGEYEGSGSFWTRTGRTGAAINGSELYVEGYGAQYWWVSTNSGAPPGTYEPNPDWTRPCAGSGTVTVVYKYWNHTWGSVPYPILSTNSYSYSDGTNEFTTNIFYTAEVMHNQYVFTAAAVATNFEHCGTFYVHGTKPSIATVNEFIGYPAGYATMNEDEWWIYNGDGLKYSCASAWSTNAIVSSPALPCDGGVLGTSHDVPWETSYALGWVADNEACVMEWRGFNYCTNAVE